MSHHIEKVAAPAFNATSPSVYNAFEITQFKNILRLFFNRIIGVINILVDNSSEALYAQLVDDATTARTISNIDRNKFLMFSNAGAVTVTVPQDSVEDIELGFRFTVYQGGTGTVTIVAGAGATLRVPTTASTSAQYASRYVVKTGANTWTVMDN